MTSAPSIAAVEIDVGARDGRVCEVSIAAAPESSATALFRERHAHAVPALVRSLFALCPVAQETAAACAIDAARGSAHAVAGAQELRLVAERIGENLRSIALQWPVGASAAGPDASALAALRAALAALRALAHGAETTPALRARLDTLRAALQALGLPRSPHEPPSGGWLAKIWRQAESDAALRVLPAPEPLVDEDDDLAMFESLGAGGCVWPQQRLRNLDFLSRLLARFSGVANSLDLLEALTGDGRVARTAAMRACADAPGVGAVAIDSPRGRLYHHVTLDSLGRVARYRIVAPTDRNFGHDGPFARALAGAMIGKGVDAELRVARLAALFDPCVALRVRVKETADA